MEVVECGRIGERIGRLMRERGLSQKELAEVVGVTEASMSRYLKNDREPKIEVVARLAKALHTTTDYLIMGESCENEFEEVLKVVSQNAKGLSDSERLTLIQLLSGKSR